MYMAFEDAELYDLDDDADRLRQRLLERMPGLCDGRRSDYRRDEGRLWRVDPGSLKSQNQRMETFFYFADREAIEQELVKVMWLDPHGNCLRITKMAPSALTGMRCMFDDGYTMEEAVLDRGIDEPDDDDGDDDDDDDGDSDDEEGSPKQKGKRKADSDPSEKSGKKRSGINKKSADYKAGYEAGYDAGLKYGVQAKQDTQYDAGYNDGKQGLRSRTGH